MWNFNGRLIWVNERRLGRIALFLGVLCAILSAWLGYAIIQNNELNEITSLHKSQTWVNQTYTLQVREERDFDFKVPYAGYVKVCTDSVSPNIGVNASYSINGVDLKIGISGYWVFPVLPTQIRFALNSYNDNSTTVTLTIEYIY